MKFIIPLLACCLFIGAKAQTVNVANKPATNTGLKQLPTGAGVFGVFDGRTPCQEIARELQLQVTPECFKLKWRITFFQDSTTKAPTTYRLEATSYRQHPLEGKWAVVKGAAHNPNAVVLQLYRPGQPIYLLKADDNVLFFLDNQKKLIPGSEHFSYTLYRTVNKQSGE